MKKWKNLLYFLKKLFFQIYILILEYRNYEKFAQNPIISSPVWNEFMTRNQWKSRWLQLIYWSPLCVLLILIHLWSLFLILVEEWRTIVQIELHQIFGEIFFPICYLCKRQLFHNLKRHTYAKEDFTIFFAWLLAFNLFYGDMHSTLGWLVDTEMYT